MSRLLITRGLPGSGKTTWARGLFATNLVSRDDVRLMLHGKPYDGDKEREALVTLVTEASVDALLAAGRPVVVHDTNLRDSYVDIWRSIAWRRQAQFEVVDFRSVDLQLCIWRDASRPNPVGEEVITDLHEKHIAPLNL